MTDAERGPSPKEYPLPDACLVPTEFMDTEHGAIRACVDRLNLSALPPRERAVRLFNFVRDEITYEFRAKLNRHEYVASHVLAKGEGFCTQKAVLLATLGRAAGVPTALVLYDLCDRSMPERIVKAMRTNILEYHGIVAFHLDGRWIRADATLSPDIVQRKQYRLVEFDGMHDALLSPTAENGAPHAEYVSCHGAFADLPCEEMLRVFHARFGEMDLAALAGVGRNKG